MSIYWIRHQNGWYRCKTEKAWSQPPGVGKLWPMHHIQSTDYLCTACDLRIVFTYLNNWKKIKRRIYETQISVSKRELPNCPQIGSPDSLPHPSKWWLHSSNYWRHTLASLTDSYHMLTTHVHWASKPILSELSSKYIEHLTSSHHLYHYHPGQCHH